VALEQRRGPSPNPELAAALQVIREERGISREELALQARMPMELLVGIESATIAPGPSALRRLARAFGVSLRELGATGKGGPAGVAKHRGSRGRRDLGGRTGQRR